MKEVFWWPQHVSFMNGFFLKLIYEIAIILTYVYLKSENHTLVLFKLICWLYIEADSVIAKTNKYYINR